jgi:hypothetical protein
MSDKQTLGRRAGAAVRPLFSGVKRPIRAARVVKRANIAGMPGLRGDAASSKRPGAGASEGPDAEN